MAAIIALPTSIADLFVRLLTEEDITSLQQLCVDCTDFYLLTMGAEPSPRAAAKIFSQCPPGKTSQDKQIFGLITNDGQMIGVVDLLNNFPEENTWYMGLIMLHPQWRGKSLGQDFVKWVESYLSANAVDYLCLGVLDINPKAKKFWENTGFRQDREVKNFQSGTLTTTAYVMKKQI